MAYIALLLAWLLGAGVSIATDETEANFQKALESRRDGDNSAALRYLSAVLKQQPDHLNARWLLIDLKLVPLRDVPLSARAATLSEVAPAFAHLATLARDAKKQSFLHFITAHYSRYYGAYDRAISEITKAVALEPNSARYLLNKGIIFSEYGVLVRRDKEIEQGLRFIREAQELSKIHPDPHNKPVTYDFQLAYATASLSKPRWSEVVQHYTRFIAQAERKSTSYAFAWHNLSIAYRHLGECDKAKEAAENALKVADFGAARSHLSAVKFCLEMQKLGMMGQEEKKIR